MDGLCLPGHFLCFALTSPLLFWRAQHPSGMFWTRTGWNWKTQGWSSSHSHSTACDDGNNYWSTRVSLSFCTFFFVGTCMNTVLGLVLSFYLMPWVDKTQESLCNKTHWSWLSLLHIRPVCLLYLYLWPVHCLPSLRSSLWDMGLGGGGWLCLLPEGPEVSQLQKKKEQEEKKKTIFRILTSFNKCYWKRQEM